MNKSTTIDGKKANIEVLTIDESVKRGYLTKQEAIEEHVWHREVPGPVDEKHRVYANGELVGYSDKKITMEEAIRMTTEALTL